MTPEQDAIGSWCVVVQHNEERMSIAEVETYTNGVPVIKASVRHPG